MKREVFCELFGEINEKHIADAKADRKGKAVFWRKWGALAACLCLVIAGVVLYGLGTVDQTPKIIDQFKGPANEKYPVPAPGEYFCVYSVNAARERYAGKDVKFLLAFHMNKAGMENLTEEEESKEYQRLADLGYKLYEVERWFYQGKGEKVYTSVVVGLFSEEELADFDINPAYGYMFYFASNGDGSAVTNEGDDLIAEFRTNTKA